MNLFSDETRRDPYPLFEQIRNTSPLLQIPPPFDAWAIFDYAGVKRALSDHEAFSSRVPAPPWFLFMDPPQHTKLRGLISRAFTPSTVAALAPRIHALSTELLDRTIERGQMDLANDFAVPLPMMIIAGMIGIPDEDWSKYSRWSEIILKLSYTRSGGPEADQVMADFAAVTAEMDDDLGRMLEQRRLAPQDDLLTRLLEAELDGERLTQQEILAFFQLLILAGQETTTNLINNAVLCLLEHPDQLERLKLAPELLPTAIEEVLRYRSPFLWTMRVPRQDVAMHGQTIPAGVLVLLMVASANRDPRQFPDAARFDITREPNAHVSFGHGIHFCIGAALARMEARIALAAILDRLKDLRLASDKPWTPRQALHVQGPSSLPIQFEPGPRSNLPASIVRVE